MCGQERRRTPPGFARYLVNGVLRMHPALHVAVLWVDHRTSYSFIWPLVELWGERRDARKYVGPWPVVCHPPCGPWGRLKWASRESREHGILAMELVQRWGGVVEQPLGSSLFREYGDGLAVQMINQRDFGHRALKPTLLYWV